MTPVPQELNWVEKRAACSAAKVFAELLRGIDSDVVEINKARQIPENQQFKAELLSDGSTVVIGQIGTGIPRPRVKIGLYEKGILATDEGDRSQRFASVVLNDEGRCILRVNETELEQWQFRKMVLQRLFFGD